MICQMTPFVQQLTHLLMLAKNPHWKTYAWHRALELDADPSGIWVGMSDALKLAMNGLANSKALERPNLTKQH